jgi:hypothetical protein
MALPQRWAQKIKRNSGSGSRFGTERRRKSRSPSRPLSLEGAPNGRREALARANVYVSRLPQGSGGSRAPVGAVCPKTLPLESIQIDPESGKYISEMNPGERAAFWQKTLGEKLRNFVSKITVSGG